MRVELNCVLLFTGKVEKVRVEGFLGSLPSPVMLQMEKLRCKEEKCGRVESATWISPSQGHAGMMPGSGVCEPQPAGRMLQGVLGVSANG